jgi:ABC-type Mn2+/Zn2+ transport system permease subunit
MSLRAFHLFFIALSVVLTAFFAAWAVGEYRAANDFTYAVVAVASLASGVGLVIYAAKFQRKTRRLS